MEQNSMILCDGTDLANWLDRADLVVRMHHRDQCCVAGDRGFNVARIDHAL
jgi:hypothetical protein